MLISTLHDWTPVINSLPLRQLTGKQILLKMECYQPVGSFKIRGIGRLCQYAFESGKRHFVSSSGGNAGYAAAYAGKQLGAKVTVFIPSTSKPIFIEAIREMGADINVVGKVWDEANEAALEYVKKVDGAYVPPFDHPLIWAGNSTIIDEVAEANIHPDAVIVSVGGGGLATGILQGMHRQGWYETPLFAVETEGAAALAESIAADVLVTLSSTDTIATSLAARRVCQEIFDWRKKHTIIPVKVTDKSTVVACKQFLDDHRIYVEPSCGAALSLIYDQYPDLAQYNSILVIVCGGIGMNSELLQGYISQFNLG